jgi:hypothetical protein
MNLPTFNHIARPFLTAVLLLVSSAVTAAGPSPPGTADKEDHDPTANRVDEAPRYGSNAPEGSAERAAQMLNERDQKKERKREAMGDRRLENADRVTRESKPDADQPTDRPSQLTPHPQ